MGNGVELVDIHVDEEIISAVIDVLESGRYVKGPKCDYFEGEFANTCGTDHGVGVSSGTAAILLATKALGIGDGDQVFVPAHTFFATVSPILEVDAEPVFVDIDPDRYTMDPQQLEQAVVDASNPTAIIVTHMHGQPVEMDPIIELASEHDLHLVEDASQAHLAEYKGHQAGSIGDVGCFSFYPTKNMTVGGDGGMVVTDDDDIAATCRALRDHGRDSSRQHNHLGLNYRLDEVKAAIGIHQLRHLPNWTEDRRQAAIEYNHQLGTIDDVVLPSSFDNGKHVYHHYPIQVPGGERETFRSYLADREIGTGVHYDVAVHEHPAILERTSNASAPNAEQLCKRIVSLPMHPNLTSSEVEYVCTTIEEYFE